jgi:hypothetical protein
LTEARLLKDLAVIPLPRIEQRVETLDLLDLSDFVCQTPRQSITNRLCNVDDVWVILVHSTYSDRTSQDSSTFHQQQRPELPPFVPSDIRGGKYPTGNESS